MIDFLLYLTKFYYMQHSDFEYLVFKDFIHSWRFKPLLGQRSSNGETVNTLNTHASSDQQPEEEESAEK